MTSKRSSSSRSSTKHRVTKAKTATKRRAKVELPSLDAFEKMSVDQRTDVFAAWLKRQPREKVYNWVEPKDCVLGQFAKALAPRAVYAGGAVWEVHIRVRPTDDDESLEVFPFDKAMSKALSCNTTFGAASDAFVKALDEYRANV